MKKKLYLLLAVCLISMLTLVACTDNTNDGGPTGETQGPTDIENTLPDATSPTIDDGTEGQNNNGTNGNGTNGNGDAGTGGPGGDGVLDEIGDGIDDLGDTIDDGTNGDTINDATNDN